MKPKTLIVGLVLIQIISVIVSFSILYSIDSEKENYGAYLNVAGKNRFYTAFALHEMDEFSSGLLESKGIDNIFNEYRENISLLKNGGIFLGNELKPLPNKFSSDLKLVETSFNEFHNLANTLKEKTIVGEPLDEFYYIEHERIEVELLDAAEKLTNTINLELAETNRQKAILEIVFPIINAAIYLMTIYAILQILRSESKYVQKLEKIYAIGQMASRLAHDLRNPITVIKGNLDFLQMKFKDDKIIQERLSRTNCSILDMNHIIEDVLEFAKTKELNLARHSLLKILNDSVSSVNVPEDVEIELFKEDVEINCDARKLQAIFVNIIVNSFDAMENKGKISIDLENNLDSVLIHISDTGPGIPDNIMSKIFEPLFSSKAKGTGLGLGISKNIVEQHGGKLSVKNNPTTFTIELPKK
ncbi:HAMP domain-containing sensor histidine kinase [Nitrosopumilus sp.]|uniref:sensor histidine kinase n=1 Tax=Nitrosopumilus sp. TaxID=2024843 RepID=UPI00247D9E2D|nr:HAMP domain-containing sensor histidine kinase [Nitrosopumilus sp.]MCV0430479.1 HAMP domain-containing histidine kinase [Nitrosopumilus sp.]